jgi:tRNA1Val (adenine37-N6)-methyltransferase
MGPTRDTLWGGRLVLWQPGPGEGYRFNLDPVLLAGFAPRCQNVVDLGAGCGVLAILLLAMDKASTAIAVEAQTQLAELAQRNAIDNGLQSRLVVRAKDLRAEDLAAVDAVVFNPPYFRAGHGRASSQTGRDLARFERLATLVDFVAAAGRCLLPGGSASAIVPVRRMTELETLFAQNGMSVTRRRLVVSRLGQKPRHALVQAQKRERGAETVAATVLTEPDLIVHEKPGRRFSAEVRELLREE